MASSYYFVALGGMAPLANNLYNASLRLDRLVAAYCDIELKELYTTDTDLQVWCK